MLTKIENGVVVEMSVEEETALRAEWQAFEDDREAANARSALTRIEEVEITPRRLREAILSQEGLNWLIAKDASLQMLREKT